MQYRRKTLEAFRNRFSTSGFERMNGFGLWLLGLASETQCRCHRTPCAKRVLGFSQAKRCVRCNEWAADHSINQVQDVPWITFRAVGLETHTSLNNLSFWFSFESQTYHPSQFGCLSLLRYGENFFD